MATERQNIHIVQGLAHVWILEKALQISRDRVLFDREDLARGPLTCVRDRKSWTKLRTEFWKPIHNPWYQEPDDPYVPSALYDRICQERDHYMSARNIFLWLGLFNVSALGNLRQVYPRFRS